MVEVPTRLLSDYLASLSNGGVSGLVTKDLTIRNDVVGTEQAVPSGGLSGQVLAKVTNTDYDFAWTPAGNGDMLQSMYDPDGIQADAFARSNHTGTQPATTITGLADVATTGQYADVLGTPSLGTAASQNSDAFATAAQGVKADTAVQPNDTQTLTNKRITERVTTTTSTATLTPNADTQDLTAVSAQAAGLTIAAPTGTPTDGQELTIRIRDNGTSRSITWNAAYEAYSSDLPTATVVSKTMLYRFIYNTATGKWDLLSGNPLAAKWGA